MKRFCYLAPLFLVWIALGACVMQVMPPTPELGPGEQGTPEVGTDEQLNANPEFILLTGLFEDIRAVIEEVNERNPDTLDPESFNEENLFTIELGDDPSALLAELFEIEPKENVADQGPLTIARIRVLPKDEEELFVPDLLLVAIEQVRLASTFLYEDPDNPISLPVYAELDLATAVAPALSVSIDPNSIGAHAVGPLTPGAVDFWQQWALGPTGIGLFSGPITVANHPGCATTRGPSVTAPRVVVFDTVPSTLTNPIVNPVHIPMTSGCIRDLDLTISEVVATSTPVATTMQYHGLFASAQIHGAAPESQIHLVRVLKPDGNGYVFDLLWGIMGETNQIASAIASSPLWMPTVFNFSLGIHPDARLTPQQWASARMVAQQWYTPTVHMNVFRRTPLIDTDPEVDAPDFLRPDTEIAVQLVIWATRQAGIIMVAASGNDATGEQYPAAFVPVLGVGAYGPAAAPVAACYSNLGDVYAPAGDSDLSCDPMLVTSCTTPDCPHAVVSVIGWPGNWQTAFWSGTSFAAPLASGMVALRLNNLTNEPSNPSAALDNLVNWLQDPANCPVHIHGRCKLDLDQVLAAPYPP